MCLSKTYPTVVFDPSFPPRMVGNLILYVFMWRTKLTTSSELVQDSLRPFFLLASYDSNYTHYDSNYAQNGLHLYCTVLYGG